ncbi:MAG: hypothetical protein RIF46_13575, partial [Cyclobacteriaceae bacterium]
MKDHSIHGVEGPVFAVQVREPKPRRPLFVSFGNMSDDVAFSFTHETDEYIDVHRILVRDPSRLFYQAGLPPLTSNIPETIAYLKQLIHDMEPSRIVVFGESLGGYAAILFGTHLNADEVHAFSPITSLENRKRIVWKEAHDEMKSKCSSDFYDLKKSLEQIDYQTKINAYYDHTFEFYTFHVENIQHCQGITLHRYPFGKHNIANRLKES